MSTTSEPQTSPRNEKLEQIIAECKKAAQEKRDIRSKNLEAQTTRPGLQYFQSLDSNVKKNGAFVKKLRSIPEIPASEKPKLLQELEKLNLRRYVSEIIQAIVGTFSPPSADGSSSVLLQEEDLPLVVNICCRLHQLYSEFTAEFIRSTAKAVAAEDGSLSLYSCKIVLRLLTELYILGVFEDSQIIYALLKLLITKEQQKRTQSTLQIILSFMRHYGEEFCGPFAPDTFDDEESPEELKVRQQNKPFVAEGERLFSTEEQTKFKDLISVHFNFVCEALHKEHLDLKRREEEKHNELMGIRSAESSEIENTAKQYDKLRKAWFKLYDFTKKLSKYLNKPLPAKVQEGLSRMEEMNQQDQFSKMLTGAVPAGVSGINSTLLTQVAEKDLLWEEEETRAFYESLPDVKSLAPTTPSTTENSNSNTSVMDQLLDELPSCCSQSLINQWVSKFISSKCIENKNNRMKLVKALFGVSRTSLELLPHYSRLVAIIAPLFKDVAQNLVQELIAQFKKLFQEKDQIKIETKIKNIRFLSELAKFQLCSAKAVIIDQCLEKLLNDFTHHNIDVTCNCLEVCGRYLLAKKETHLATKQLLEKMMRLREIKSLDLKYDVMIENAYYEAAKPFITPTTFKVFEESDNNRDSNIHRYIHHLLYSELNKHNGNKILKQLRKLPWNDSAIYETVLNSIRNVKSSRYSNVHLVASVVSGLARYHDFVGVAVVDRLLEDIRVGLTNPSSQPLQKRLLDVKFLGELYNYQLVDAPLIFEILFTLILHQSSISYNAEEVPPEVENREQEMDFAFRLRLVCCLLDTVGPYLEGAQSKKRLDRFLLYLQRYVLASRKRLPIDIEYTLADTLDAVRPKLRWPKSLQDACAKIEKIEKTNPQATAMLPTYDKIWPIVRTTAADNDEDDTNPGDDKEEAEETVPKTKENQQRKIEELQLDKELEALIQESLQEKATAFKPVLLQLPNPQQIARRPTPVAGGAASPVASPQPQELQPTKRITVLMRKGKQKTRDIDVPADANLVQGMAVPIHQPQPQLPPQTPPSLNEENFPKMLLKK